MSVTIDQAPVEVTKPVAVIDHGGKDVTNIFVLREDQKFRFPGVRDESARAWMYGPSGSRLYVHQKSSGAQHPLRNERY